MKDLLKRLTRMVIGYGAVQWAGPFLSLVFTPIITRALTPADYGVADYIASITAALATLALFAMPQAITTHYNDHPEEAQWPRQLVGTAFTITWISGFSFGILLIAGAPYLTTVVPILHDYTRLLQFVGATFAIGVTTLVLTTSAQMALRVRWGMVFSLITIVGTVAGNLLLIVVLRLGATGMVLVPILTGFCLWAAALAMMRHSIGRPRSSIARLLLRSGAVLFPSVVAVWVLQVSDRIFLAQVVDASALGYYAIANRMASLVAVVMGPISGAWTPLAMAVQYEANARAHFVSMARYLIAAVLVVALGIGLFATEILIVLTRPAYLPAAPYVGFLTYVYVFSTISGILTTGAYLGKQLASVTQAALAGAAAALALNVLLIPRWGIAGAVVATVVGYGLPQIVLYLVLQRRFPIQYPIGAILMALGVQFLLLSAGLLVPSVFFPLRIALKGALMAVMLGALVVTGLIKYGEVSQAPRLMAQAWRKFAARTG